MTEHVLISPCKVCGTTPYIHQTNVMARGCSFHAHVIECDNDDEQNTLPFLEHTMTVYGSTLEEAIERWEEVNND